MKPKDIFGIAVRVIGLLFLYQGLAAVPGAVGTLYQATFPRFFFRIFLQAFLTSVLTVGWPMLVAWWMIRGAPLLMRIAYAKETAQAQNQNPAHSASPVSPSQAD
jgi:hypothetical protein